MNGYLNNNQFNRYPFKDLSSLVATEEELIPDSWFLDAQITCKEPDHVGASLVSLESDTTNVTFHIGLLDVDGDVDELVEWVVPISSITPDLFFSYDYASAYFKLIVGQEFIDAAGDTLSYTLTNTVFLASCVILKQPTVDSFIIKHLVDGTATTVTTVTDELLFEPGYNVSITDGSVNVVVAAGLGLYDACSEESKVYTINGVGPDTSGNFKMAGDGCYQLLPGENLLSLNQNCIPGCNEDVIKATAYYMNRLKSGMLTVADYVGDTQAAYTTFLAAYTAKVEQQKLFKAPFLRVIGNEFVFTKAKSYPTFATGIYLPDKAPLEATLEVELPDLSLINEDYEDQLYVLPHTQSLKIDDQKRSFINTSLGFTDLVLECKNDIVYQFTLSSPLINVTNNTEIPQFTANQQVGDKADIVFTLTHDLGEAGYIYPMLSHGLQSVDYFASHSIVYRDNSYYITVELELFCSSHEELATTLFIQRPKGLKLVADSTKLYSNNTSIALGETPAQPGFAATLDYSKRNLFRFEMIWAGDSCTDTDPDAVTLGLPIFLTCPKNAFTRTLNLNFNHA